MDYASRGLQLWSIILIQPLIYPETNSSCWALQKSAWIGAYRTFGLLKGGKTSFFRSPLLAFTSSLLCKELYLFSLLIIVCCDCVNQGMPVIAVGVGHSTYDKASVSYSLVGLISNWKVWWVKSRIELLILYLCWLHAQSTASLS